MEQPTQQTIYSLFNGRIQFQVPVYQRAYVWNEDENWAILWDDIADTAGRFLEDPEAHARHHHFLGPIVLSQRPSPPSGVDPRLVIDGQQRLTTLQIIIAATAAAARDHGADGAATDLTELTANRGQDIGGDDRYKIWPSRRDREDFLDTIDNGADANASSGIPGAWRYFRDQVEAWITDEDCANAQQRTARVSALKTCLEKLLYVVAINLDDTDNAQVIFETLNARGTGLGALDLIKNAVFLQAQRQEAPADQLHDREWEPTFENDDYWLEETRQGRVRRVRADWFLMHWLAMELGEVVRADKLFDTFRKDILRSPDPPAITALIPRLCVDAKIMRSFDDFDAGTPEGLFFSRLETLDTTTMLPVALFLFRTPEVTPERRRIALAALESWLVRRMILRLTPKAYNRTLATLLLALRGDPERADEIIVDELRSSEADTALWPSDDAIRDRLERNDIYNYIRQDRVRMLLEACELDLRNSTKTEIVGLPAGLSIEHALPRSWQKHWPAPPEPLYDREAHVNRLGNLTLVTQPLNSTLSNSPWVGLDGGPSKRKELAKRSVLLINQQLCEHDEWEEYLIEQRGAELTERVLRTWPGPDSDMWPQRTMRRPPQLPNAPDQDAIRQALRSLATAPRSYTILESQLLLGLAGAQKHMPSEDDSPAVSLAEAVRRYLSDVVTRISNAQSRVIIEVVLGLGDPRWQDKGWRRELADARRARAGELFRGMEGVVASGTIRQLYEPRALDEFASVIWRDEKEARGEPIEEVHDSA